MKEIWINLRSIQADLSMSYPYMNVKAFSFYGSQPQLIEVIQ